MFRPHALFIYISLFALSFTYAVIIDTEGLPETGLDTSDWQSRTLPPLEDMWCLNDMQIAAKNTMSRKYYNYFRTAVLDEITYQANLNIWHYVRLNGYDFRDVSDFSMETSILGYKFSAPFFIAPAARAGYANKDTAELSLATAAGKEDILYIPSISATKELEEIAAVRQKGQVMFHQEYIWADKDKLKSELKRMEKAGYKAIFLTVDNNGIKGIRTRSLRTTGSTADTGHDTTFDLKDLASIQSLTTLPIVPKGIKTASDARACLDAGFKAIYVSNHGGRTLDGAPTAVEILLDIRENAPEVFKGMEVYADGGVRRGNHVITLLALGARAVGLGRSPMYANIWGEAGVRKMIQMLKQEIETTMALMGAEHTGDLDSSYVNTRQVENMYFG